MLWKTVEKKIKSLNGMGMLEWIYSVKQENIPVHYVSQSHPEDTPFTKAVGNELMRRVSIMEKLNGDCPLWGRAGIIENDTVELVSLKATGW